jgi:ribosomal subunit interface protein
MALDTLGKAISVQSSKVDLGDTFRHHAQQSIVRAASKYFGQLNTASVHVTREGPFFRCTVNIQMSSLKVMSADLQHESCYVAFNGALAKVEKQLRRAKRELREDKPTRVDKDVMIREGFRASPAL